LPEQGADVTAKTPGKNRVNIRRFSSNFPVKIQRAILSILAKQALPLNEQGGFVLTAMMREMLRLAHTVRWGEGWVREDVQ